VTETEQKLVFEDWLRQYKNLLFKIVRAYAFSEMDRDDLFQEIAIQVWRSVPSFRGESAVTTWLYRIALNTAIKWVKREHRNRNEETLDQVQHILQESKAEPDDQLEWLYAEIYKLDEVDRSITLLMLDGLSYKEMAVVLGITESNIGVKINRIKKRLISKSQKYDHHGI